MSKRKTEQGGGSKKKSKSNLETLELDLENRKPQNGPPRIPAPAGVERFSDEEDDSNSTFLSTEFLKADKRMNGILKTKTEKAKSQRNAQQLQAAHVSDSEEDDAAADQMTVTAHQQARELQAEDGDPEPVVLQQVLFPAQAPQAPQLAAAEKLVISCQAELKGISQEALRNVDLPCTLLLNGWLQDFCFRSSKACSAALVQSLFQLLVLSKSLKVATAAYKLLMALLGDTRQHEAMLGCLTALPTVSSLYEAPAEPPGLEAAPSVEDFTKAFQALGLALADTPRREQREDLPDTALNGSKKPAVLKGTLYHLQLLLRTLAAVCRYQKQGGHQSAADGEGLQTLLLMLLRLHLDPNGQLLAIEIQAALESLLDAFVADTWLARFAELGQSVARIGPNHRAHLAALKQLPAHCDRGFALQQAGAACLLSRLCSLAQGGQNLDNLTFSSESAVEPEQVIAECSWFQAGGTALAKACQEGATPLSISLWEVETCIKAADLLLWPHVKQAKETGTGGLSAAFRSRWQEFIQALSRGLSNSHKVAAHSLKLHIAVMQAWDN